MATELATHITYGNIATYGDESKADETQFKYVSIYVWVDKLSHIDEVNQTFESEFDLVLTWNGTKSELDSYSQDPQNFTPKWLPDFKIKNGKYNEKLVSCRVLSQHGTNTDYYGGAVKWDTKPSPILIERVTRVDGTFVERFELFNFPLDCQDIQINFELKDPMTKCMFYSAGLLLKNSVITGYAPGNRVFFEFYCTEYGGGLDNTYSIANLKFKFKRVFSPYFWKIGLVLMITSLSSILAFAVESGLSDQLGLLFTLLLTIVAFQFVASSYVPNLDYLTYLDYYIAATLSFVFGEIVLVTVIDIFELDDDIDLYAGIGSFVCYVIIHIIFLNKGIKARKFEMKKMEMDAFDYYNTGYMQKHYYSGGSVDSVSCWSHEWGDMRNGIVVDKLHKDMLNKQCYSYIPNAKSKTQ